MSPTASIGLMPARLTAGAVARRRASRARAALALVVGFALLDCASKPLPPVMARVDAVRTAPASAEAQTWAPQAYAHAVQIEGEARAALGQGDAARAEVLAEHAIAAFEQARALTRLARAERRRLTAEGELAEQRQSLAELHAQHQRLTAEAAGLELRTRVVRAALPMPPHETAEPERQQARRRAAGALATQGRLLCMAARLLGESAKVESTLGRLDQLDRSLAGRGNGNELETATELRSECLRVISAIRRQRSAPTSSLQPSPATKPPAAPAPPTTASATASASVPAAASATASVPATASAPAEATATASLPSPKPSPTAAEPATSDQLLTELSSAGVAPSRDDRGVSVVLRGLFDKAGALTEPGREELRRLGRVAQAHPEFPLLVVNHAASPGGAADAGRKLEALEAELGSLGLAAVDVHDAGEREPLVAPRSASARQRNERIELVFVAPGF